MTERARLRGDRKVEPNDSPETPDRNETSDTHDLPLGTTNHKMKKTQENFAWEGRSYIKIGQTSCQNRRS